MESKSAWSWRAQLTAFCWNVQDGRLPEKDLVDFQNKLSDLKTQTFDNYLDKLDLAVEVLNLTSAEPKCWGQINSADLALRKLQRKKFVLPEAVVQSMCVMSSPVLVAACLKKVTRIIRWLWIWSWFVRLASDIRDIAGYYDVGRFVIVGAAPLC